MQEERKHTLPRLLRRVAAALWGAAATKARALITRDSHGQSAAQASETCGASPALAAGAAPLPPTPIPTFFRFRLLHAHSAFYSTAKGALRDSQFIGFLCNKEPGYMCGCVDWACTGTAKPLRTARCSCRCGPLRWRPNAKRRQQRAQAARPLQLRSARSDRCWHTAATARLYLLTHTVGLGAVRTADLPLRSSSVRPGSAVAAAKFVMTAGSVEAEIR